MAAPGEVQATIARALCMEDGDRAVWPCATCTGDALDVLAALTEAGYFEASVARKDVEGLLADLVECGRSAIESTRADAFQRAAAKVETLLTGGGAALPARRDGGDDPAAAPSPPRLFELVRHHDVSGLSGTGVVAEGVVWSGGSVSLHWLTEWPSVATFESIDAVLAVHGHNGATTVQYRDDEPQRVPK